MSTRIRTIFFAILLLCISYTAHAQQNGQQAAQPGQVNSGIPTSDSAGGSVSVSNPLTPTPGAPSPAGTAGDPPAVTNGTADCTTNDTMIQNAQINHTSAVQSKAAKASQLFIDKTKIRSALYSCRAKFKAMSQLNLLFSNPLALLKSVLTNAVTQMINQVCSMVMADITTIMNAGLSQFNRLCLPLPRLNIGSLGKFNMPKASCNGVNFFNPQLTPTSPNPGQTNSAQSPTWSWKIWGQSPTQPGSGFH